MAQGHDQDPQVYNYSFPHSAVAASPASPRDSARLLVFDRNTAAVSFDTYSHIDTYLPKSAVLVFNETKVVPARFFAYKATGGKVELLYLGKTKKSFDVLANKKLKVGDVLTFGKHTITIREQLTKGYRCDASFSTDRLFSILERQGVMPLPPYIKNPPLSERKLRSEYQTVFAKTQGSSAAPTASLHFTKRLLQKLKATGYEIEFVTLHVGLGTFAPLTEDQINAGVLHREWYEISPSVAKRLLKYKKEGRPIIAVGTTVVRTLESAAGLNGSLDILKGETSIFIRPPYSFKFINGLVTNFHVPKSSLMMLVASLIGREKLLELYALAIRKKFRLFSFGDGMLIK